MTTKRLHELAKRAARESATQVDTVREMIDGIDARDAQITQIVDRVRLVLSIVARTTPKSVEGVRAALFELAKIDAIITGT